MPNSPDRAAALEVVAPDRIAALGPEWSALWRRCPLASPFGAPEWLLPWARHHAPGRCGAVALRLGGRLAGLVPVFVWEGALLLAGTGPSDRADILVEPGAEWAVPRLLAALPGAASGAFERIDLQQLPPGAPVLRAAAPEGWRDERRAGEPCYVARLGDPDGLGGVSERRRANWRYGLRRLEREGWNLGLAGEAEIGAAMADLVRLHALRWRARGEAGVLADPLLRGFLLEAAPALAGAGLLRLWELRRGDRRIAALLVLAGRGAHHYYLGGFDPAFAKLSPSTALVGAAMAGAHREGASAFDFLRGAETYKADWGAEERPMHRRILTPPAG